MNPSRRARVDLRILREDDPEHDRLTNLGWRVVSRSWGARLTLADGADVSALEAALAAHLGDGTWLAFGASAPDGGLVAFTILRPEPGRWEVERAAVDAEHRRRGLATAVKAASILATRAAGARCWGTGGAAVDAGSPAVNRALGFEFEPAWHAPAPPPPA